MIGLGVLFAVVVVQIIVQIASPVDDDQDFGDAVAYADQGRRHLLVGETFDQYNSFPPTSGPQAATSAAPGIYGPDEPSPFNQAPAFVSLLPILEQGGIVIYYDSAILDSISVSELVAEINTIRGEPFPRPNVVFTPLPGENLGSDVIYATAWRHVLAVPQFDEDGRSALAQFVARNPSGFYERFQFEQPPLQESLSSAE
jgi:hypothetical protein